MKMSSWDEWCKDIMDLSDEDLADELTRYIYSRYGADAFICETLRRLLLRQTTFNFRVDHDRAEVDE